MERNPTCRYVDPLDALWIAAAQRIGLRVERSRAAYAASDGHGTLYVGRASDLDADDCLAQLIFHELCHSLIEGEAAFGRADWGLASDGTRDDARERACLRVQAALAGRFDLVELLAPTTEFRTFYDSLGSDPLEGAPPDEGRWAHAAWARAFEPPWAPHLERALEGTAGIVRIAMGTGAPEVDVEGAPTVWKRLVLPRSQ